jgi:hypothetical protein
MDADADTAAEANVPVAFVERDEVEARRRNYTEFADHNPCDDCSAPCCRLVILPQPIPETFTALDRMRYLVAHRGTELLVDRKGNWRISSENPCRLLTDDHRCSVHGTSQQPKICVNYSPHGCWYKRNFHDPDGTLEPPDLIRMDLDGFDRIVEHVRFDEHGRITDVPPFDDLRRLAAGAGTT